VAACVGEVRVAGRVDDDEPAPAPRAARVLGHLQHQQVPHPFTGGTIKQVAIHVSGEAYVDLEREAALMLMRQ